MPSARTSAIILFWAAVVSGIAASVFIAQWLYGHWKKMHSMSNIAITGKPLALIAACLILALGLGITGLVMNYRSQSVATTDKGKPSVAGLTPPPQEPLHQPNTDIPPRTTTPHPKLGERKKTPSVEATPVSASPMVPAPSPAPLLPPVNADHSPINFGTNFGTIKSEDNRQYGVPKPPPAIVGMVSEKVSGEAAVSSTARLRPYGMGQGKENPGLRLSFNVTDEFVNPMFIVRCDQPCLASEIRVDGAIMLTENFLFKTKDPRVVGFTPGSLRLLLPTMKVVMIVRSQDSTPLEDAVVESYAR